MNFNEAYGACKSGQVVYYDNEPHEITYATSGGDIRPVEGVANIRPLNSTDECEVQVSVSEISLFKAETEDHSI